MTYRVTACTTMGHLLDMSHSPQTLENARLWAKELASLPAIRHVLICKLDNYIVETFMGGSGESVGTDEQDTTLPNENANDTSALMAGKHD